MKRTTATLTNVLAGAVAPADCSCRQETTGAAAAGRLQVLGVNSFGQDITQDALPVGAVVLQQKRRGSRAAGLAA